MATATRFLRAPEEDRDLRPAEHVKIIEWIAAVAAVALVAWLSIATFLVWTFLV